MKTLPLAVVITAIAITTGCSSDPDNSDNSNQTDTSVSLTGSAALPEQMSLVSAQDETTTSGSSFIATRNLNSPKAIADTSGLSADSDYITAKQNIYVWLDAVEPISFIDSLLCFTNQSQPLAMKGQGDYISWNDASRCFEDQGGSGGDDSQGSAEQVQQFVTIVGNSSQASATSSLIYRGWVEDYAGQSGEDGGPSGILILGEVSKTPTDDNPFGEFTLTYGLLPTLTSSEADNVGFGEVVSSAASGGGASFTLYQTDSYEENSVIVDCTTSASVDYNESTQTGFARTGKSCVEADTGDLPQSNQNAAFALAVNSEYVHMGKASSYADIDANTFDRKVCLARDGFNSVVWNYSLYNKADGSEVAINSGMQIKVDSDGDGTGTDPNGFENWAHIGYWGSWREDGQDFSNGETVQQAKFDDTTGDNFTITVAPGRLIKNTVDAIDLADLDGVTFSTWLFEEDTFLLTGATDFNRDSDTTDGIEVVLEANSNNDGFEVTGVRRFNDGQMNITAVSPAVAVPLNDDVVLNMWSRQLGGNVRYLSGASKIRFFTRSFVDGSETSTGELFASATSVSLKCFDRCLDTNITVSDVSNSANQGDVFRSNAENTAQDYTFAQSDLTLKIGADKVGYASNVTKDDVENSQYWSWGLNSGPMVSSAVASDNTITDRASLYSNIEDGSVTEFYVWETGLEHWQQQIVLVDGNSDVVSFDKPITIKYSHVTSNDRNGDAAQNGKVFLLEYGGKGQLWGLPSEENNNRWGPVINLKDGTLLGASDQYIIKARDVEQRMQEVANTNCSDLPLTAPSQPVPTGITGNVFDIGTIPNISDEPPSVVDGELTE